MHFVEKKKYFKNWNKAEGEYPIANLPKWRFFYFIFFKSNIKFTSANLLLIKKEKKTE